MRERKGFITQDGHRYTSVPAEVPAAWSRSHSEKGLVYSCGVYRIVRKSYVGARSSYNVIRDVDGVSVDIGFSYSRLKDAKAHAVRNANGLDVFNWA